MGERGQASVEWLGAVALVALVLLAAGTALGGGPAIAGAVVRQVHRALCIVSDGVCDLDERPCAVAANATIDQAHVNIAVVRVGRDELILREHRSDGSVLVTYLHDTSIGLEGGGGADAWVHARGIDLVSGDAARAALLVSLGGGETWLFPDGRSADRGMAYLGEGDDPPGAQRAQVIDRAGVAAALEAHGERGQAKGALRLDARYTEGAIVDQRDGRRTFVVGGDGALAASGVLKSGSDKVAATAALGGEARLSVTTDEHGRPLELTLVRSGAIGGSYALPDEVQPIAESMTGGAKGGRRWVLEQRLDLTDASNRQAAQGVLDALGGPLPVAALAGEALQARIAGAGVTELRTYDLRAEDGGGAGAHVAVGVKLGGAISDRAEWATLVDARVRGADGQWRSATGCLR